jgi:uncharacterized membrane protein
MDHPPQPRAAAGAAFLKRRGPEFCLGLIIAVYCVLFLHLVHQRYLYFELYDVADTATNIQTVWSLVHPPVFTATVAGYLKPVPHNVLGDQLYFTLALYLPFWLVFKGPFTFVAVTILAAGAAAIPLFAFARERLGHPWLALAIAAHMLFNPLCYDTYFLFGFRPETLSLPFLLAAFALLFQGRRTAALVFFLLVLLTKHDSILVLFPLGLILAVRFREHRRLGLILAGLCLIYLFAVVIPLFHRFAYAPGVIMKALSRFGPDPLSAVAALVVHPGLYLREVSRPEAAFLATGLISVGLMCLPSPYFYAAAAIILYNFLYNEYGSIHCGWHWALVAGCMYLAVVDTLAGFRARGRPRARRWFRPAAYLLLLALFAYEARALRQHLQYQRGFYYRDHRVNTAEIIAELGRLEPEASVASMHRLLWFVSGRRQVTDPCHAPRPMDYLVLLEPLKLGQNPETDWCVIEAVDKHDPTLDLNYRPLTVKQGLLILKRK